MRILLFAFLVIVSVNAFSLCSETLFQDGDELVSNGHSVRLASDELNGKYRYFVMIDGSHEEVLTILNRKSCGNDFLEPRSIVGWGPISDSDDPLNTPIYEFYWDYVPVAQAYPGKYFCFMYVLFDSKPDVLFNSCQYAVDNPGVPKEVHTGGTLKNGVFTVESHNGDTLYKENL